MLEHLVVRAGARSKFVRHRIAVLQAGHASHGDRLLGVPDGARHVVESFLLIVEGGMGRRRAVLRNRDADVFHLD